MVELESVRELTLQTGDTEVMILPLAGGGTVEADSETFELSPRASVFDGPADMVYIGIDNTYTLRGEGRFAICGARAKRQLPNRRVAATDVPVELRGTGNCSRQVQNFGTAGVFEADSLMAVEVITPGGNWSSYPAHKHDENTPVESALEEIYYFEIDSAGQVIPVGSAITVYMARPTVRSRCSRRCAAAMSSSSRTATTVRPSRRPGTTCTT